MFDEGVCIDVLPTASSNRKCLIIYLRFLGPAMGRHRLSRRTQYHLVAGLIFYHYSDLLVRDASEYVGWVLFKLGKGDVGYGIQHSGGLLPV